MMPSVLCPSSATSLPRTSPWRLSLGAVRKYSGLIPVKSADVFDGETVRMPEPALPSRISFVTLEDAAPIMAVMPALCRVVMEVSYALLSRSPSSAVVSSTWMPASASLISETASWTPASIGAPRKDSDPVEGRRDPSCSVRSTSAGRSLFDPSLDSGSGVLLQPVITSAVALASARPASHFVRVCVRFIMLLCDNRHGMTCPGDHYFMVHRLPLGLGALTIWLRAEGRSRTPRRRSTPG